MNHIDLNIERPKSIKDIVYENIKEQIVTCSFQPGTRLIETELTDILGVSRTPLREALNRLEADGLVTRSEVGGLKVSELSVKEVAEIYDVRSTLEVKIIKYVAENWEKDDLKKIDQFIQDTSTLLNQKAGNKEEIIKMVNLGDLFHECLYNIYGNNLYKKILNNLKNQVRRYAYLAFNEKTRIYDNTNEHIRLRNLIKERKVDEAGDAMKNHIINSYRAALKQVKDGTDENVEKSIFLS